MRRPWIVYVSLATAVGCKGTDALRPASRAPAGAAFAISDGAHFSPSKPGNPDFFFLPPMVPDPSRSPNFDKGAFNANLTPTVDICEIDATTAEQVNAGAPCRSAGYVASFQLGPRDIKPGDDEDGGFEGNESGEPYYHLKWMLPKPPKVFYKIRVRVGAKRLGFADVMRGEGEDDEVRNVSTGDLVPVKGGKLAINFRIERYALCETPGTGPCASAAVDLTTGGTVTLTLPFSTAPSGISIPAQPAGSPKVTITVQTCPNLNDRVLDLPTFGSCVRVTADPPLPPSGFVNAATVFICDLTNSLPGRVASPAQESRLTMHKLDIGEGGPVVTALPHAGGCPTRTALAAPSFGRLMREVARGEWKSAFGQLAGLAGPRSLYATGFLDQGGGGVVPDLSDFQFALPAKMLKVAGDNQSGPAGARLPVNPKVLVTDLGNEPVRGARVTFATSFGSVTPTTVLTGADGSAEAAWTLRAALVGRNVLVASGRGIAGSDFFGPRKTLNPERPQGIDPFQPIQSFFDGVTVGGGVLVRKGSQTFTATGFFSDGFEAAGWAGTAFWNRSTLLSGTTAIGNAAFPGYVDLAPGDASAGKMPAPKTGAYASWYGVPSAGNYIGTQLAGDGSKSGGTGTAPNTGVLTSPDIVLPSEIGFSPTLRFDTWWEIESVNPSLFDIMRISVQDVGTGVITSLGVLNPARDPGPIQSGPSIPFTSAGLNAPPAWVPVTVSLNAFRGKTVRLLFTFDTRDARYNGFRGWLIDNVRVAGEVVAPSFSRQGSLLAPQQPSLQVTAGSGSLNPELPPKPRP